MMITLLMWRRRAVIALALIYITVYSLLYIIHFISLFYELHENPIFSFIRVLCVVIIIEREGEEKNENLEYCFISWIKSSWGAYKVKQLNQPMGSWRAERVSFLSMALAIHSANGWQSLPLFVEYTISRSYFMYLALIWGSESQRLRWATGSIDNWKTVKKKARAKTYDVGYDWGAMMDSDAVKRRRVRRGSV